VTFSGGTGKFTHFNADVVVTRNWGSRAKDMELGWDVQLRSERLRRDPDRTSTLVKREVLLRETQKKWIICHAGGLNT